MPMNPVIAFYEQHPINEQEILAKLQQEGKNLDSLVPEDLFPYDQDHYGGLDATDRLMARLSLKPEWHLLDICSGMGGPARYLAHRNGCQVTGVDFTESRVKGANRLTARVGLQECVRFLQGDATAMDFPEGTFDGAFAQEAFLHVPNKPALLAGAFRALKPGGWMVFTDWLASERLTAEDRAQLREGISAMDIATEQEYRTYLEAAGFVAVVCEDVSAWWRDILKERLVMYRSLEEETVRLFGRERHDAYIRAYTFFVDVIDNGRLGGGRFHAAKP